MTAHITKNRFAFSDARSCIDALSLFEQHNVEDYDYDISMDNDDPHDYTVKVYESATAGWDGKRARIFVGYVAVSEEG